MTSVWRGLVTRRSSSRDEAGYVAVLVAILASSVLLGLAAIGVDTARWAVEVERLQKAADAAALAGVPYMPYDFAKAQATAISTAAKNGFSTSTSTIVVVPGTKPSQLRVTITSIVPNAFGASFGVAKAPITRTSMADFTAPAPMGSPCNTFGNEPKSGSGAASPVDSALPQKPFASCPKDAAGQSTPQFWAVVEGAATDKIQGDRYQTSVCTTTSQYSRKKAYGCASGKSTEYREDGYMFVVHVEPAAVGKPIDLQAYDPAFINTGVYCGSLPVAGDLSDDMNPFTTSDGKNRYSEYASSVDRYGNLVVTNAGAKPFCNGDYAPGEDANNLPSNASSTVTSFVMRGRTATNDPLKADPITTSTCQPTQFRGFSTTPAVGTLTEGSTSYNPEIAKVFHQWVSVCRFTPDAAGDYYLQVRSNVALTDPSATVTNPRGRSVAKVIYQGNPATYAEDGNSSIGHGANTFSLRAVPSNSADRNKVAVSSYERMPLFQNASGSTAIFNLVRALPNTRGQFIAFDFYDAADGSDGTVTVLPPLDATGSIKSAGGIAGCRAGYNDDNTSDWSTLSGCKIPVSGDNTDGQVRRTVVPIPNDYNCSTTDLGGCWFRVQMSYSSNVTDVTTWSANIIGDPVRIVE